MYKTYKVSKLKIMELIPIFNKLIQLLINRNIIVYTSKCICETPEVMKILSFQTFYENILHGWTQEET